MTENESVLITLQNAIECATDDITKEDLEMMVKCLEELQQYRAIGTVEELQKSVKEEDVLKFYYIESEDKYVVGKRVDTFYYAEVGKTGLAFYMSRYLPWGEHVVDSTSAWKEHTYPSEPKEIPFFDWLQGFMKKEYGGTIDEFKALKEKSVEAFVKWVDENYDTKLFINECEGYKDIHDYYKEFMGYSKK